MAKEDPLETAREGRKAIRKRRPLIWVAVAHVTSWLHTYSAMLIAIMHSMQPKLGEVDSILEITHFPLFILPGYLCFMAPLVGLLIGLALVFVLSRLSWRSIWFAVILILIPIIETVGTARLFIEEPFAARLALPCAFFSILLTSPYALIALACIGRWSRDATRSGKNEKAQHRGPGLPEDHPLMIGADLIDRGVSYAGDWQAAMERECKYSGEFDITAIYQMAMSLSSVARPDWAERGFQICEEAGIETSFPASAG